MSSKLEEILANHCSPALFGIKSSNLINCSIDELPYLEEDINSLNNQFKDKICFDILYKENNNILLLVYKIDKLKETLFEKNNQMYLIERGYPDSFMLDDYINCLKKRISFKAFPHEIGVFLGYDLDDVIDFCSGNKESIYVGYWKVYSKLEEKIKIFNEYTKCKNTVTNLVNQGKTLESII